MFLFVTLNELKNVTNNWTNNQIFNKKYRLPLDTFFILPEVYFCCHLK